VHGLEHHLAAVQPLLDRYGYGAVFLFVFVEGFGIPAPGQITLIAAALLAARGDLSIVAVLVTALVAAATGNLIGFAIGRYGGRRILERVAGGARLARMEALFERRGGVVVGFGRFVDGLRQLAGIAAGSLGMSFGTFFAWNLAGAVAWAGFWGGGAYLFERDFAQIAAYVHHVRPIAIAVVVIAVIAGIRWLRHGRTVAATATR
jgi:membrane protein DedA with SNARE-associated domain